MSLHIRSQVEGYCITSFLAILVIELGPSCLKSILKDNSNTSKVFQAFIVSSCGYSVIILISNFIKLKIDLLMFCFHIIHS